MITLKEAREKGELKQFIKEHSKDPKGDKEKFDKTLKSISSQKKSKAPQTSSRDESEN